MEKKEEEEKMDQPDNSSAITNINQIITVPNSSENNLVNRNVNSAKASGDKANVLQNQSTNSTISTENAANTASKRPKNTALKQQRLPAWQPILTAKTVLPLFFTIGVIFVVLGGVLLYYSNIINEFVIDYTDCKSVANSAIKCSDVNSNSQCVCAINFSLSTSFQSPVFMYYGLSNFYQNHRRYVKSRDDNQLLGQSVSSVNSECSPYDKPNGTFFYAPCGAIANSLFNDSFSVSYNGMAGISNPVSVPLLATGIAWSTDKNIKFQNPANWNNMVRPPNWNRDVWNLSTDPTNNGYKNEDLIVWMRTAALPTFRKFYRRVDHANNPFTTSLPAGNYTVLINYNFPVTVFEGRKSFIISTTSWIGGKNPFLGIAYLVVGSLCIVLGFVFLIIHFKFSRSPKPAEEAAANYATSLAVVDNQRS